MIHSQQCFCGKILYKVKMVHVNKLIFHRRLVSWTFRKISHQVQKRCRNLKTRISRDKQYCSKQRELLFTEKRPNIYQRMYLCQKPLDIKSIVLTEDLPYHQFPKYVSTVNEINKELNLKKRNKTQCPLSPSETYEIESSTRCIIFLRNFLSREK